MYFLCGFDVVGVLIFYDCLYVLFGDCGIDMFEGEECYWLFMVIFGVMFDYSLYFGLCCFCWVEVFWYREVVGYEVV